MLDHVHEDANDTDDPPNDFAIYSSNSAPISMPKISIDISGCSKGLKPIFV